MTTYNTWSRLFLLCCLCCTLTVSKAQWIAIPDTNFGNWLNTHGYSAAMTGSNTVGWQLNSADALVTGATSINCDASNIKSLTGISAFTHLSSLSCRNNPHLRTLPVITSSSSLTIDCSYDSIVSLPLMSNLTYLFCSHNFLKKLSVSNVSRLDCDYNQLMSDSVSWGSSIDFLVCSNNQLTYMPTLPVNIRYLICDNNHLNTLGAALPSTLREMDCSHNQLTSIPSLPSGFYSLICSWNQLTSIPTLNPLTVKFYCGHNPLTALPVLPTNIYYLECNSIGGVPLPASLPDSLRFFYCDSNQYTSLPALPLTITDFFCSNNLLTSLPTLPPKLRSFQCFRNLLTALPALPDSLNAFNCDSNLITSLPPLPAKLTLIYCSQNLITSIPALPAGLYQLWARHNLLTSIANIPPRMNYLSLQYNPGLTCLPHIEQTSWTLFDLYGTNVQCLPVRISAQQFTTNLAATPLCDAASGCEFSYNIGGTIHMDTAVSCTQDSLHPGPPLSNMKVRLRQGGNVIQQFYSFNSGGYSFKTPTLSGYTVDIDTTLLPVGVSCPQAGYRSVSLSPADSVESHQNFGMRCAATDYGVVSIRAGRLRPGTQTGVSVYAGNIAQLMYNAHCGAGVGGTVVTTLSGPVQYGGVPSGSIPVQHIAGGNILQYDPITDLDSLTPASLNIYLTTDSDAQTGDQVCITTTITPNAPDANATNNTVTECYTVVNSWDPNYKEVSPATTTPDASWLTYTIHFQNTGSDTAYLVVLRDTLSQYVDASSFQYLASSHHAVIQLDYNAMTFTFPHINLVDSATNPLLSEGWIQYRVRSNANLPAGTSIDNTAYIYFDNNSAVATNTASTLVAVCVATNTHLSHGMCAGDVFTFHTRTLTAAGAYADTLQSVGSCDSIISLTLTIKPSATQAIHDTAYDGDFYLFGGDTLRTAGTYYDTLQSANGCDSTVTLYLATASTGINVHDIAAKSRIYIYPNPNTGLFTLQTSNSRNSSYIISNSLGEVIRQDAMTTDMIVIDMHDTAAGVYTLTVKGTQSSRQVKFVVMR